MTFAQKKYTIALFNIFLLWGAWYVSGYGVMVGRSGNLGMNCQYLTARGLYDQPELATTISKHPVQVDNCAAVYGFDAHDK